MTEKIPEVCKTCRCFDNRKFPKAYSCADIFMDILCLPHLDGTEPLYPPLPKPTNKTNEMKQK